MPGGGWRLTGPTFIDSVGFVGRARRQPPPGKCEHNIKTGLLTACTSLKIPVAAYALPDLCLCFLLVLIFVKW